MAENCKLILLTGFDIFGEHTVNPSWDIVIKLQKNHRFPGYEVVIARLSVGYSYVDKVLPDLWRKYKPYLVIHLGVLSNESEGVKIECQATRTGYIRFDGKNENRPTGFEVSDGLDVIKTEMDVYKMCEYVFKETGLNCKPSDDAGRFICEYTYFTSLNMAAEKSLLMHVPKIDEPYSVEQLTKILYHVINFALDSKRSE